MDTLHGETDKELVTTTTTDQAMETQDSEGAARIQEETPSTISPLTTSPAATDDTSKTKEEGRLFSDEMKFMKDFDPNQRVIQKKMKKFTESGVIVERCDCLIPTCPGCHYYPCASCNSRRCGQQCREGRRWEYELLEIQGGPTIHQRKGATN